MDQNIANIITELTASTLANSKNIIFDNMSNSNALFYKLQQKGKVDLQESGVPIQRVAEFDGNDTYSRIKGYDNYKIDSSDVFKTVSLYPVQGNVIAKISGYELKANSGVKSRIFNLWKGKLENSIKTLRNNLGSDLYSDGSKDNQIKGMQYWIREDTTSTALVGGIDQATTSEWRNKTMSLTSSIVDDFRKMQNKCTIANETPDLILTGINKFEEYESDLSNYARYISEDMANAKFRALKCGTADVIFDGTDSLPENEVFFINTDYFALVCYGSKLFECGEKRSSQDQNAVFVPIEFMGNLLCTGRKYQGLLS